MFRMRTAFSVFTKLCISLMGTRRRAGMLLAEAFTMRPLSVVNAGDGTRKQLRALWGSPPCAKELNAASGTAGDAERGEGRFRKKP
jgi:hypothetical protein